MEKEFSFKTKQGVISTESSGKQNTPKVVKKLPPSHKNNRFKPKTKQVKNKLEENKYMQIDNYFKKMSADSNTEILNSAVLQHRFGKTRAYQVADQWERLGVGGTRLSMSSSVQNECTEKIETASLDKLGKVGEK